ncbi:facilitated trehalose transporter Tret1-like [Cydia pomonella]|uniref:facilitated trehalose transporter Tret1-like n=1 Tax=Cydia pomonella TaxID=82600 RepID=UPI002ADD5AD5|nr:facilitated trehalose transporter Tret1-like [Cydia pomonella]
MFIVRRFFAWKYGSRFNQYLMAVILSIPLLCFGMIQGWLSPMRRILESSENPIDHPYTKDEYSWAASVTYITAIILGLPLGYFMDRFGRKFMSLVTISTIMAYWLIKIISLEPASFIAARAVAGFPCSAVYIIMPCYIKEISDIDLRSAFGSLYILIRNVGYLISYVLADLLSVYAMLWVGFGVAAVIFLLFLLLPETPEYLIKTGKVDEAKEVMAWLRGISVTDDRLVRDIDTIVYRDKQTTMEAKSTWGTIFHDSTTRKAFIISWVIKVAQQFDGYLIVLIYASSIFDVAADSVNIKLSANQQVMVVGAVQLVGSMSATALVEKTGTKKLLVGTSFTMGVGMGILSIWFYLTASGWSLPGWIPVLALCLAIISDAAGFQPVSYIVITDMFTFHLRGQVSAFINVCGKGANFIQVKGFHALNQAIGIQFTFLIFALICFGSCLFCIIFFPETRGRSLDEIYKELAGKNKKDDSQNQPQV